MAKSEEAYPLVLSPAYKDYLWGGQAILKTFNRSNNLEICAESWEASDRQEGPSIIDNGPLKGKGLQDLLIEKPHFFGTAELLKFPLLIKLIDANKALSIQVHPNDDQAKQYGGEPKSEMWHILEAQEKSKIYLGFKNNLSQQDILKAVEAHSLKKHMNAIDVKKGETYYIPAGLIHSIGEGCLIYEVQQNSNTTYRLYDWGRQDHQGAYRKLHLKEALQVMNEDQIYQPIKKPKLFSQNENASVYELLETPYFSFNKINLKKNVLLNQKPICHIFFVAKGELLIQQDTHCLQLKKGSSFILPAMSKNVQLIAKGQEVELLETIPNRFQ